MNDTIEGNAPNTIGDQLGIEFEKGLLHSMLYNEHVAMRVGEYDVNWFESEPVAYCMKAYQDCRQKNSTQWITWPMLNSYVYAMRSRMKRESPEVQTANASLLLLKALSRRKRDTSFDKFALEEIGRASCRERV